MSSEFSLGLSFEGVLAACLWGTISVGVSLGMSLRLFGDIFEGGFFRDVFAAVWVMCLGDVFRGVRRWRPSLRCLEGGLLGMSLEIRL